MKVNFLSQLMFYSALFSLLLALYIYKRRTNPAMFNLLLLLVAVIVWTIGYGLELSNTNLQYIKLYTTFAYLGIATVPVLWFLFVARYSGNDGWLTPLNTGLLFVIPLMSIILVATNDLHYLFYSSYGVGTFSNVSFLRTDAGLFWWIHVIYSYLVIISGIWILGNMYKKVDRSSRFPVGMFIVGLLLPYAANIIYVSGFKPYGFLDITPVAFIAMAVILTYGFTSKKAIDVTPLAYDLLFQNIPDSIFVLDTQGRIVNQNPAARKLIEYELKLEVQGSESYITLLNAENIAVLNDGAEFELGEKTFTVSNTPILSPGHKLFGRLVVLHDVTDRKIIEQQLEQLSFNDQLTGLYNRRHFENELMRLGRSREHPIALISADLDGLKQINDTLGHAEGDRYLKACASLLNNTIRSTDTLARVGGDEFALLLPRMGRAEAELFIIRVRQLVQAYNSEQNKMQLSISFGLEVSNNVDFPLEEAFKIADNNMYADKSGRSKNN